MVTVTDNNWKICRTRIWLYCLTLNQHLYMFKYQLNPKNVPLFINSSRQISTHGRHCKRREAAVLQYLQWFQCKLTLTLPSEYSHSLVTSHTVLLIVQLRQGQRSSNFKPQSMYSKAKLQDLCSWRFNDSEKNLVCAELQTVRLHVLTQLLTQLIWF